MAGWVNGRDVGSQQGRRAGQNALLAGVALAALVAAGPASAQSFDRVITFGDSLSDNGNVFRQDPAGSTVLTPYHPLTQGRYTNGLTWAENLAVTFNPTLTPTGPMNGAFTTIGNVNNAFGFAQTGVGSLPLIVGGIPNIRQQITNYVGAGGTFGAGNLVTMWGGANNMFVALAALPPAPTQAQVTGILTPAAVTAATDMGTAAGTVAALGARTLLVANLPDLGATPSAIAGGPGAQAAASFASSTFNTALETSLATAAATAPAGTNIIRMDVATAFTAIAANPTAFGLTNVTQGCVFVATCVGGTLADQAQFLFWDTVHPTAAGHALVTQLAIDYLSYGVSGGGVAVIADVAQSERLAALDDTFARLDAAAQRQRGKPAPDGPTFSVTAYGRSAEGDARGLVPDWETSSYGMRFAVDRHITPAVLLGIAFGYGAGSTSAGTVDFDSTTVSADLYARWRSGGFFVQAVAGVSGDTINDYRRVTLFAGQTHTGDTRAFSFGGALSFGYEIPVTAGVTVIPTATLTHLSSTMDGFRENGPAARLVFDERTATATLGELGIRLDAALTPGMMAHVSVGYRAVLASEQDALITSLFSNTALPVPLAVGERDGGALRVGAGLQGHITPAVSIGFDYAGAFASEGSTHQGRGRLAVQF